MAYQLHIRQNLESAGDHFGPGRVCRFDLPQVRIGSSDACECRIEDSSFAPCHVVLRRLAGARERVAARPQEGAATFLNGQPLTSPTPLRSGDELRVGHWTLRFQRLHERVGLSLPFSLMSTLAKVAVALVLAAELLVVLWLPRRVAQSSIWGDEIARHRVTDLLDALRRRNRDSHDAADFERALRREIDRELLARSTYLAQYGDRLSAQHQRQIYAELCAFERILAALAQGTLPAALPEVDVDSGVQALLGQAQRR